MTMNSEMRDLLDLINEMSESEGSVELNDSFAIELGEDLLIESGVVDLSEDGILIQGDEKALELLAEHGAILEDAEWSKLDEKMIMGLPGDQGSKAMGEGMTKDAMMDDAEKMSLEEFCDKYGDEDWVKEFYHTTVGDDLNEAEYQGRKVPLGKPMKGDVKKSKVYVKGPKGNVVKVNFGDKNMRIKKNIPGRRKNFRARHNCDNPGPRWKARYWSCRAW